MPRHRGAHPLESIRDAIRGSDPMLRDCRRCAGHVAVFLRRCLVSRNAQAGSSNRPAPPTHPMPRVAIVTLGGMRPPGFGCAGPTGSPRTTRPRARDMAGRRTDGDFARTHQHSVQPWQVPRLQVQSACRSREQRLLHGDEILVGVEHDVAHAGATEPVAPAEQSEASWNTIMVPGAVWRAAGCSVAVEALQKAQWDMRAAGGLADVLRRIRRAMEHRPAHRFVEHFDAVQGRLVTISAGQSFQHIQRVFHQVRILRPFAHARQTAVVETIL